MLSNEFVLTYKAEGDGLISAILHRKIVVQSKSGRPHTKVEPVSYSGGHRSKKDARVELEANLDNRGELVHYPFSGLYIAR